MPHEHSRVAARPTRALYLSYDGMCDPLGGSQVLPYLIGLSACGHKIDLISFEKAERSAEEHAAVARVCTQAGIRWHPLPYHKRPPILSAIYDVHRMRRLAERLHRQDGFDLIHCRSYLSALVGLKIKRRFGVPFIFDMRGFWADERLDGGIWNLSNPLHRLIYRYFKRREAEFLAEAGEVVSLTEAGRQILLGWRDDPAFGPPITVIPCCTDSAAFAPVTSRDRAAGRKALNIPADAKVATYLGSFGSWYMVEEMLDFFRVQLEREPSALFLIVSREPAAEIRTAAISRGVPADRLIIRAASRADVPGLIAAADYGLFFIKPVFSKKASSPTKMGEFLALEIPIVTNSGVGDVDRIMAEAGAGAVVETLTPDSYRRALDELAQLKPDMARWRNASRQWFDLETGVKRYNDIYERLRGASETARS
jgi:glycosyltransferase involved in cell wall biosynthesis